METITSHLAGDHARCDALFAQALKCVAASQWSEAAVEFAGFGYALERHLVMEERIVFPAFEKAVRSTTGPTSIMRSEHLRIRGIVQRLSDSVDERDAKQFFDHADTLRITLQQHGEKEEGVLYPMIERLLGARQCELVASMVEFGAIDAMAVNG
jgi:iron-sulfur cluster repair protein YtfE (RIC family)